MSKIVNLSEATSIAFHGLVLIARSEKTLNVVQIAEQTCSSKHHVAKVMQQLVKRGFLGSVRGPSGGFYLKKSPEEINFLNIFETIEGKLEEGKCPMEKPVCSFDQCLFSNIIKKMTCDFRKYLEAQVLANYIEVPAENL